MITQDNSTALIKIATPQISENRIIPPQIPQIPPTLPNPPQGTWSQTNVGDCMVGRPREQAKKEWCEDSGIPLGLFEANCLVGSRESVSTIEEATGIGQTYFNKRKKIQVPGLDLSEGFWWSYGFDWRNDRIDYEVAQFKTIKRSEIRKGEYAKYLTKKGMPRQTFYLQVTEAEVEKTAQLYRVNTPPEKEGESVTARFWEWVINEPRIPIIFTEGIKKAAAMLGQGIPAIAIPGVNNIYERSRSMKTLARGLQDFLQPGRTILLGFDADTTTKLQVFNALRSLNAEILRLQSQQVVKVLDWGIHEGKGLDDLLVKEGTIRLFEVISTAQLFKDWVKNLETPPTWEQYALERLELDFNLYYVHNGKSGDAERWLKWDSERRLYAPADRYKNEITEHLNFIYETPPTDDYRKDSGSVPRNCSSDKYVTQYLNYLKKARYCPDKHIDPEGYYCLENGIFRLETKKNSARKWETEVIQERAEPYLGGSEERVFTKRLDWAYDPNADRKHLDELISFLPKAYRGSLLQLVGCGFNLGLVRQYVTRESLPAIVLKGEGQNGKDTLRKLFQKIFKGEAISNTSLREIQNADMDGNGFGLWGLAHSKLNFVSENANTKINNMQTLKAIITGDPIKVAQKYRMAQEIEPQCINIFCTNEFIYFQEDKRSLRSRFMQIDLPYQFVDKPDPNNPFERKADSKYTRNAWINTNVVPALFNVLVEGLDKTLNEGIEWANRDEVYQANLERGDHVRAFIKTVEMEPAEENEVLIAQPVWEQYLHYAEKEAARGSIEDVNRGNAGRGLTLKPAKIPENKYDPPKTFMSQLVKHIQGIPEFKDVKYKVVKSGGTTMMALIGVRVKTPYPTVSAPG